MRPEVNLAKRLSKIFRLRLVSWEQRIIISNHCKTKCLRSKNETYSVHDEPPGSCSREGVIFFMSVPGGGVIQGNTVIWAGIINVLIPHLDGTKKDWRMNKL